MRSSFLLLLLLSAPVLPRAEEEPATAAAANLKLQEDRYYFLNEVTGAVQLEDPGNTPFETEDGVRYWLLADGTRALQDPHRSSYLWTESWSEQVKRFFYYNQATHESTWERPADMGWRRVRFEADE